MAGAKPDVRLVLPDDLANASILPCLQCKLIFIAHDLKNYHIYVSHVVNCKPQEDESYLCFFCDEKFNLKEIFQSHFLSSDCSRKTLQCCKYCSQVFINQGLFQEHTAKCCKKEKRYACFKCELTYKSFGTYKLHEVLQHFDKTDKFTLKLQTDEYSYDCAICSSKFVSNVLFVAIAHKKFKKLICKECILKDASYNIMYDTHNQDKLRKLYFESHNANNSALSHQRALLLKEKPAVEGESNALEKYSAKIEELFLLYAEVDFFNQAAFKCALCSISFRKQHNLETHFFIFHKMKDVFFAPKYFHCHHCPESASTLREMSIHIYNYHGISFNCYNCPQILLSKHSLRLHHSREHAGKPYYTCYKCSQTFTTQQENIVHQKWHEECDIHQCDVCKLNVVGSKGLKSHMDKLHSGSSNDKYLCSTCGFVCETYAGLNKHMVCVHKTHMVVCMDCGYLIPKYGLKTHELHVHKKGAIISCEICALPFKCKSSYSKHKLLHTTRKAYALQCDSCIRKFNNMTSLRLHRRYVHFISHKVVAPKTKVVGTRKIVAKKVSSKRNVSSEPSEYLSLETYAPPTLHVPVYQCSFCSSIFQEILELSKHEESHHEQRKTTCRQCGKIFANVKKYLSHRCDTRYDTLYLNKKKKVST